MEKFKIPTTNEVKEYAESIGYNLDPDKFIDYYEMVGWRVNKQPMKNWKAAVRTWKRNEKSYQRQISKPYNKDLYAPKECDFNDTLTKTAEAIDAERQRRLQASH